VELIGIVLLAVLGVLGAAVSRQVTDEFKAWTPRMIEWLIRCAVRQLPEDQRERFAEEWRSDINETPGEIGKICVAISLLSAPRKMPKPERTFRSVEEPTMEEILASIRRIIAEDDAALGKPPSVACGLCGAVIDEAANIAPEQRKPCFHCGSTARRYSVEASFQGRAVMSVDCEIRRPPPDS
jgi:hypothetical protein